MTDRQLLELAAKAAGYDYKPCNGGIVVDGIPGNWNPLIDDGDALRLAVDLNLQVACGTFKDEEVSVYSFGQPPVTEVVQDRYAATRRAIVRAAAAIGEKMK